MSFIGDLGRVGLGVMTGGVSEVVGAGLSAGYNAVKPNGVNTPAALRNGATDLGAGATKPNPAYQQWLARRAELQAALAKAQAMSLGQPSQQVESLKQQLAAHNSTKPPETIQTTLGERVGAVDAAGTSAGYAMQAQTQALQNTGAQAQAQGQQVNAQMQQQSAAVANRAAPQMAPEAAATLAGQQQAINDLNRFAPATQGVQDLRNFANAPAGPSASEAMLRLQAAKDKASALSRARSARGGPGAVAEAMKGAQAEAAGISSDTRGQMALVQADEAAKNRANTLTALTSAAAQEGVNQGQVLDARKAVVDATSRVRDQDITVLRENLGAQVQTLGLNDQQVRFFTGLGEAARQQGIDAMMQAQSKGIDAQVAAAQVQAQFAQLAWSMLAADQQVELQRIAIEQGIDLANAEQKNKFVGQVLGFLGTGVTAAGAASDRRVKTNIKKVKSMADELRRTAGHSWDYKSPEKHGKGRFTGPMAQDLEKSEAFRSAVKEVNGVKMVDATRLTMTHHAALHDLQKQIDRLARFKGKRA